MKREIGRALEGELRHVRVDAALRGRILSEARRRSARRNRRVGLAYAAAALAVAAVGVALIMNRPMPDLRRPELAAAPTAAPAETTAVEGEANLYLCATAYEGGALTLESSYQYGLSVFEADAAFLDGAGLDLANPDESWYVETAEDAGAAGETLNDVLDAAAVEEWAQTHENGEPMGLRVNRVSAWPENVSTQLVHAFDAAGGAVDATEYQFYVPDNPGNRLTLYLTKQDWTGASLPVALLAGRESWVWDGGRVFRRMDYAADAVRQLSEDEFSVEIDENLTDEPLTASVALPVVDGAAEIYTGSVTWGDAEAWAENAEATFGMTVVLVRLDGVETALLLQPEAGHSFTARLHAVTAPRMVLQTAAHPGMAGWLFAEAPDAWDVVDMTDEFGNRTTFTVGELIDIACENTTVSILTEVEASDVAEEYAEENAAAEEYAEP